MVVLVPDREKYVIGDVSDHVGYLNCKRISERSHIHEWSVESHFHEGLAQLFVFGSGRVKGLIDTARHDIDGPALVWMPEMITHAFDYPADMQGWVLTVPSGSIAALTQAMPWITQWVIAPQLMMGPRAAAFATTAQGIATMALDEVRRVDAASNAVLESLFRLLLTQCHRALATVPESTTAGKRRVDLLTRFQRLLDQDNGLGAVADYADRLGVTTTHLSRRTKAVTGRTAGEMIADRFGRLRIVFLHALQRVVGQDDAPPERVVGTVAFQHRHLVRGIAQFHRNREIEPGRAAAQTENFHGSSRRHRRRTACHRR